MIRSDIASGKLSASVYARWDGRQPVTYGHVGRRGGRGGRSCRASQPEGWSLQVVLEERLYDPKLRPV